VPVAIATILVVMVVVAVGVYRWITKHRPSAPVQAAVEMGTPEEIIPSDPPSPRYKFLLLIPFECIWINTCFFVFAKINAFISFIWSCLY
jgi:hypothetical protein